MKMWKIRTTLFFAVLGVVPLAGAAMVTPGNPQAGQALYQKNCMSCHAAKFGGDGSQIFTRAGRKVQNMAQLQAQVTACSVHNNTGWFPSDEANVAAWLNQQYYRFK